MSRNNISSISLQPTVIEESNSELLVERLDNPELALGLWEEEEL